MKYDIIVELKSNSLIDKLDFDEQNFLRKVLKSFCNKPGRVKSNEIKISSNNNLTVTEDGRKLSCESKDKQTRFEIIIQAGGVFKYKIYKESEDSFRLIEITSSTKSNNVFNTMDIYFYDSESIKYIEKGKQLEIIEFEKKGIIPDEEERLFLPSGEKGTEEIIEYIVKTLQDSDNDIIGKLLLENERISTNSSDKVYLTEDGKIQINNQEESIPPRKIKK